VAVLATQQLQQRLKQIYDEMICQGNLRTGTYKADNFPYVAVPSVCVPQRIIHDYGAAFGLTCATKSEERSMGLEATFSHCETYPKICKEKKRLMFVVSDLVPEEFRNPCAAHLYVKGYYEFSDKNAAHALATKAEFEEAERNGTEFLKRYTSWWMVQQKEKLDKASRRELGALKKLLPPFAAAVLIKEGYAL